MLNKTLNKKVFINPEKISTRDGYGEGLIEAGKKNKNVVAVSADLSESVRAQWFAKKFPQRFFEVGVAEQNLALVGAGLALGGKIPFLNSYAVFSPARNWDHIRTAICYNNANVKIVGSHGGLATGPDGATHQALEDIAIMRVLPNMTVVVPCDVEEAREATLAIASQNGPAYLRLSRPATPVITTKRTPFKLGQAEIFMSGRDLTLIACGPLVYEALKAAEELAKEKIRVEVINCHTIKPLDKKTILRSVRKTKRVITLEDHQIAGGLGGAVAELLAENYPVPIKFIGIKDKFGESGETDALLKKYGLTREYIIKAIKNILKKKIIC
ncbi:MAG: transketolase family protein [Patescibacteria group bacterium]|nr:transketolase family protein [Patescibacteria group bacterium]MDD5490934.1 transketolase family protein [Patescibacteria group bacterium]